MAASTKRTPPARRPSARLPRGRRATLRRGPRPAGLPAYLRWQPVVALALAILATAGLAHVTRLARSNEQPVAGSPPPVKPAATATTVATRPPAR